MEKAMSSKKGLRRFWAVYCSDGELWETDLGHEVALIEVAYANSECDQCDGPHVATLESESLEAQAKAS